MDEKQELRELEKIDIYFVNHQLKLIGNIPAYSLFFFIILIVGILSFNLYIFIFSILLFLFLMRISIFFTKKNITFLNFFSMIGYIFKPKYIIIRKKDYFKGRKSK